jgi:hypothetical protein
VSEPIYMKKGDRLPSLVYELGLKNQNLTAPASVVFKFEPIGNTNPLSILGGACTIIGVVPGSDGYDKVKVQYDWAVGDTDVIGRYHAEFVANYAGKEITFPNGNPKYLDLTIVDDVTA